MVRTKLIANLLFVASIFLNLGAGKSSAPNPGLRPIQTQNDAPLAVCDSPKYNDPVGVKRSKYICEMESYLPLVQGALEIAGPTTEAEQNQILAQLRVEISKRYNDLTSKWLKQMIYCHNIKSNKEKMKPIIEDLKKTYKTDADLVKVSLKENSKDLLRDQKLLTTLNNFANKIQVSRKMQNSWSWVPGQSCSKK